VPPPSPPHTHLIPLLLPQHYCSLPPPALSTTFGGIMSATFNGCPDLTELEKCEHAPQQSWCETTVDECRQQAGESVDDGWVFCNAETKQPELPYCTCKAKWWHTEGACANMKGGT
jgi:hypothetical protein